MFGPLLPHVPPASLIAVVLAAAFLFGLVVHNVIQARLAARLGDPAAVRAGYGSVEPQPHLSLAGVALYLLLGLGLARSVPLRLHGRPAIAVLLAGPLGMIVTAFAYLLLLRVVQPLLPGPDVVYEGIRTAAKVLLLHAVFYLLPLPALDGGRALQEAGGTRVRRLLSGAVLVGPIVLYILWLVLQISGVSALVLQILWSALQTILSWLPF